MPVPLDFPGVYVEEVPSGLPPIVAAPTATALFVGWAAQGPTGQAVRLSGFAAFERVFGGLDARSLLGYAVRHFYDNGGDDAYVLRIAADQGVVIGPGDAAFHAAAIAAVAGHIEPFNLLIVPGLSDAATLVVLHREAHARRALLIADAGPDDTSADAIATAAALAGTDPPNATLYFPWIRAADPLQPGVLRAFPPSGFVAGVIARTDRMRGVWKAPAGSDAALTGAVGMTVAVRDAENGRLNAGGVNCLRVLPNRGPVVWGARTVAGADTLGSEWKYVPVRRLALLIEESVIRGTAWAVFEANDAPLWAQLRLRVGAFLQGLFREGAFQGHTPDQAYFVKCDAATMTRADLDSGYVHILIGFAPVKPAEFVVLNIRLRTGGTDT
ncbi:phage tail sheath family protein [Glacieibacterium frigidum]|uniref:Phage tail sheath family protein n=1 Tax=Glacieibacterium frigidum TaxID=2593303 RepID=A0A552U8N1_9SPHN|nr:phage tail sheath subtilisin-like domain-containing protein [Glacieibacterium frigidum]TRW14571.1 phage tail sheath family protein [Glacieibacterium frigidum]